MNEPEIAAIIVAAGTGSRTGLGVPKQFAPLGRRPVLAHSHAALASHPRVGRMIVAIGAGQDEMARVALAQAERPPILVTGGATRRESVHAALERLDADGPPGLVLIHDAARPFLPHAVIDRLIAALESHEGATPVLPLVDTLVRGNAALMGEAVPRDGLYRVQTPQAFRFGAILAAHRAISESLPDDGSSITDDAGLLRATGRAVALCEGDRMLEKLTYAADFARAEARIASARLPRTGTGFDVHRLVPGKTLWLCGIEIPHEAGLSGHSDADVAIHALVDAILGALAEGDIGSHFPPGDPRWKDAPSHRFLSFARERVSARGGEIAHVDVTIVCEAPKIGPHRERMRLRLAELLAAPLDRVSVKATTTERLGFAGRREGIAAQAVATLMLPIV